MDPVQAQLERAVEWLRGEDPDQQYQVNLTTTSTFLPCLATAWQGCDAVTRSVVSMHLGTLQDSSSGRPEARSTCLACCTQMVYSCLR